MNVTTLLKWLTATRRRIFFLLLIPFHFIVVAILTIPLEPYIQHWFWRPWRRVANFDPLYIIGMVTVIVFIVSRTPLGRHPVVQRLLWAQIWYFFIFGIIAFFFPNWLWHYPLGIVWLVFFPITP